MMAVAEGAALTEALDLSTWWAVETLKNKERFL